MLKDKIKRFLAAMLCFSFIAPMIPEFQPLEVRAEPSTGVIIDKISDSTEYKLLDNIGTNLVRAKTYIEPIINDVKIAIDNGDEIEILSSIGEYLRTLPGKEGEYSTPLDVNGNLLASEITDSTKDSLKMIPIRITSVIYGDDNRKFLDVGAIDVLGYRTSSNGVELVNVGFSVVGIKGKQNYARLYGSVGSSVNFNDSRLIADLLGISLDWEERDEVNGDVIETVLSVTSSEINVYVKSNLFDTLYGESGSEYMTNAGYGDITNTENSNVAESHISNDPLKSLFRIEFDRNSGNPQKLTGLVKTDIGKLTDYKERIASSSGNADVKIDVVIGGESGDMLHVEDGHLEGINTDNMAFRIFANDVMLNVKNEGDGSARDTYIDTHWKGRGCFICEFINAIYKAVADWNFEGAMADMFNGQLGIFDEFHMIQTFMYHSISYCNDNGSNAPKTIKFTDKYNPNNTPKVVNLEDVERMFKTLPEYKQAALAVTYTNLMRGAKKTSGDYFFDYMYIKGGNGKNIGEFNYNEKASRGGDGPYIDEEILARDVKEFNSTEHTLSGTPVEVARYADLLARYCYVTGTKYNDSNKEASNIYCEQLDDIGAGMWNTIAGRFNMNNDTLTADMAEIPQDVASIADSYGWLIEDSMNTVSDYAFNRLQTIFYAVSYSFQVIAHSEFKDKQGYSAANLRKWLNGKQDDSDDIVYEEYFRWLTGTSGMSALDANSLLVKTDFKSDSTDINLWMFQCILALHDLCESFDIDPATWNDEIYEYYMIYEDHKAIFEALRQNGTFMGTGYMGNNTAQNPLGRLFSITDKKMNDNWMRGFALSSTYMPMVTNLYDSSTYDMMDDGTWLTEYFYRYGFHRKALYISTDPNIVVNSKVGRTSSNGRKVCTLKDLLNYDRDIELYIDTGFYNADDIAEGLGRVDYATIRSMVEEQAYQATKGTEAAENQMESQSKAADDILRGTVYNRNYVDETLNLDTATLLKDDGVTTYSTDVAQHVTKFGQTADLSTSLYDAYVLSSDSIVDTNGNSVFDLYQYSALLGYGVVSAIYRDTQMFNTIMASTTSDTTVFRSSKNIIMTEDSTYRDWLCFFNYLMLGNLEKQMNVNVDSLLDLNAPIFIDLFGNIVTESGYVIIPAAMNPTLCGINWNPYGVGFAAYLNNNNEVIKTTDCTPQFLTWITGTEYKSVEAASINGDTQVTQVSEVDSVDLETYRGTGGWFIVDKHGRLILKNVELRSNGLSSIVSWSTLNAHSDVILKIFYSNAYYDKAMEMYGAKAIMLTTEVLRGAPVETIDYEKEGLNNVAKGEAGIVIAYAMDNIFDAISSSSSEYVNSMLVMPDPTQWPYFKYLIYFGVKICVLILVLFLMISLFKNGINGKLGFKSAFSFVMTTIIVVSAIYILPASIKWSYDNANAKLLSTEACDIVLYDAMRNSEGQEIGITSVEKIGENTELYMEVGKVHVNWQNVLTKGLLTNEYTSFQDIFDDAMTEDPMANQWGVVNKGSTLYMSTRDIYDSTRIVYNAQTNTLTSKLYSTLGNIEPAHSYNSADADKQNTYATRDTGAAVYSFVSPYYVFLDMLVANINDYNQSHDIKSYNFSADKYGGVITYDVASPYLLSDEFLYDGYDILGLYQIMRTTQQKPSNVYIFTGEDIAMMSMSEWYDVDLHEKQKIKKIEQVYDYARAFVSDHRSILKHVPDSMFIKALAFACAVKYNQVFNAPHADAVRMIQVDNRDIMRFMLGDFYSVYSNYPYSFGRYVYKSAGTAGVLLSLILAVIIMITSVLKPLYIWATFFIIIINILFRHTLLKKPNWGVEGYFIGCGFFMVINFIYALLLKLTMIFANTGYPVVVAIIIGIVTQIAYMIALAALIKIQLSDWKDLGFGKMSNVMAHLGGLVRGLGRGGFGRGYGAYGYGAYGRGGVYGSYGYGGIGGGFGRHRRGGFGRRNQYSPYGAYDAYGDYGAYGDSTINIQLSDRRSRRQQRRINSMRTVDDMYARDEERYDNAFRKRGRR